MTLDDLAAALRPWRQPPAALRPDLRPPGSPDRALARHVFQTPDETLRILEETPVETLDRKRRIAEIMERIAGAGFRPLHPYRRTRSGDFASERDGRGYLLRPFVEGTPLERPAYLEEPERFEALADVLLDLRAAAKASEPLPGPLPDALPEFLLRHLRAWRARPDLAGFEPAFRHVERNLLPRYADLPRAFCHGDFHPLNVVWNQTAVRSVIDWEFCGPKPEAYDAALLLGCIGFDDPDALIGPCALRFLDRLKSAGFLAPESLETLPDLLVAIRLGWLAEWLRRADRDAVALERRYLDLLLEARPCLADRWTRPIRR